MVSYSLRFLSSLDSRNGGYVPWSCFEVVLLDHSSHTLHWVSDVIVRPHQCVEVGVNRLCPLFREKPQSDSPLTDPRNHVVLQGMKLRCNACPWELLPVERKEAGDIVLCVQTKRWGSGHSDYHDIILPPGYT